MYEVIDGLVYEVKEVVTETQTAVIRKQVHDVVYNEEAGEFKKMGAIKSTPRRNKKWYQIWK